MSPRYKTESRDFYLHCPRCGFTSHSVHGKIREGSPVYCSAELMELSPEEYRELIWDGAGGEERG